MRAARKPHDHSSESELNESSAQLKSEAAVRPVPEMPSPLLRIRPFMCGPQPRRFQRVPTHVVGVHPEHRRNPRAKLALPLRLRRVSGELEPFPVTLVTRNISSTGVYFLCPRPIGAGTAIELEVYLVHRPLGRGSVHMTTLAHVVRTEPAATPGWHGIAATFDDVEFERDEVLPPRFCET